MVRILRVVRMAILCALMYAIISGSSEIYAIHVRRITPFAEVVQSSVQAIQRTISSIGTLDATNVVVEAFGGVFEKGFTSADVRDRLESERRIASMIVEYAADYQYSMYRLPYIADYCGMLLIKTSSDGRFQDYTIVYDGREND